MLGIRDAESGSDPAESETFGGHSDVPAVEDTAGLGGSVWIVLFGGVMILSVAANVLFTGCVLSNRKKHSVIYFLMIFMFAVNLVDYALLIFEFSLGMGHEYPYMPSTCNVYQIFVRGNPILQAATILVILNYATSLYCTSDSNPRSHRFETTTRCSRTNSLVIFLACVAGLLVIEVLFSIPTALFASIVTVHDKHYCEIDLGSVASGDSQQQAISIFYLLYSAVFSFWLPLVLAISPLYKLYRSSASSKYPEVSVVSATAASFFVFFLLHGSVVFLRHFLDAWGLQLSTYDTGIIKLAQSFFWLVAFFWHFTRPALAMLLDPDLKQDIYRLFSTGDYDYSAIELPNRGSNLTGAPLRVVCMTSVGARDPENGKNEEETTVFGIKTSGAIS